MTQVLTNAISLEVEEFGPRSGVPLMLIPGLGSQLVYWPQEWIDGFADNGYRVIVFDNRDVGLSEKFASAGVPDIQALKAQVEIVADDVPYTIDDMADDTIGILDALGIQSAHILGKSMGGLILQSVVHRYPDRVRSATIVVSTSGAPDLPPMRPDVEANIFADSYEHAGREVVIEGGLKASKLWASPKYPFDPVVRGDGLAKAYDRSYCPEGVARQTAALLQGLGKEARLEHHDLPTLVVQGMTDTIFPKEHGRDLAKRIAGARLLEVDGMGHDLEKGAIDIVFQAVHGFIGGCE